MKKIVSIVNPQQGAGKTGLAVNIAACLALFEKKTLLVDGDPVGHATAALLSPTDVVPPGFYAFLGEGADELTAIRDTSLEFLKIVPAGSDLYRAEQELFAFPDRAERLNEKIAALAETYDYVLIDSPSSLGPLTVSVMAASAAVLIPLPCRRNDPPALETLLPVVAGVKKQRRPDLTIAGIVLTQCDGWETARTIFPEEMMTGMQTVALNTVVPVMDADAGLSATESLGVMQDVMSKVSETYLDLTAELLER